MNPLQTALKNKSQMREAVLKAYPQYGANTHTSQSFSPLQQAIYGKIKTASSPSGTCMRCKRNSIRKNPKVPPLHPNCKCSMARKTNTQ